jgi:hypothetical protein
MYLPCAKCTFFLRSASARAHDGVHAAVHLDDVLEVADLTDAEAVCSALEWLLYLPGPGPKPVDWRADRWPSNGSFLPAHFLRTISTKRSDQVQDPRFACKTA